MLVSCMIGALGVVLQTEGIGRPQSMLAAVDAVHVFSPGRFVRRCVGPRALQTSLCGCLLVSGFHCMSHSFSFSFWVISHPDL